MQRFDALLEKNGVSWAMTRRESLRLGKTPKRSET